MEKNLIQELKPLSDVKITHFSQNRFSDSDFFAMHKVLLKCAESFNEYINETKEPIRFTDNVVPLKKEFLKFTNLTDNLTLFRDFNPRT